jgi:hypothetical protein
MDMTNVEIALEEIDNKLAIMAAGIQALCAHNAAIIKMLSATTAEGLIVAARELTPEFRRDFRDHIIKRVSEMLS